MKTYKFTSELKLIDVAPDIPGFTKFLGAWVIDAGMKAIMDPGPTASIKNLFAGLKELKLSPEEIDYVFVSHIHMDHSGGLGTALKEMPKARVIVHEKGAPHLINPARLYESSLQTLGQLAKQYGPMEPVAEDRIIIAKDGDSFDLGDMVLEALDTPGHASHHLCFWDKKTGRLFIGEAAGVYNDEIDFIRPNAPHPFNLEKELDTLDRLISLKPESLYYAHFGCTDAGGRLDEFKKRIILWGKIISECMKNNAGIEDMYKEILKKDAALALLNKLPADRRDRELFFVNNSIKGLVSYFNFIGGN